MRASEGSAKSYQKTVALTAAGFTLGADTRLMRFDARTGQLTIAADRERCLALPAIAARGARLDAGAIQHLEAAADYWDRGDKALANLRLVFAGLPRLHDASDAARLRAAEYLLDHGMTPRELLDELDIDSAGLDLEKYNPDQPRVPPGQGKESGRWWDGVSHWLAEEVPVYDQDTGDVVGTRSRGSAIATNPLTIIGAGGALLLGGEVIAGTVEGVEIGTVLSDGTIAGADAVGAAPNLTRLGIKFGINADSEIGANLLRNLNTPVHAFISENRLGSILRVFPSEFLGRTVGQALVQGGSTVRKLLLDSRFAK